MTSLREEKAALSEAGKINYPAWPPQGANTDNNLSAIDEKATSCSNKI